MLVTIKSKIEEVEHLSDDGGRGFGEVTVPNENKFLRIKRWSFLTE
jgi:hypothetical protein